MAEHRTNSGPESLTGEDELGLARQLAELDFISAAYPEAVVRRGIDNIGFEISLHAASDCADPGRVSLNFSFPSGYPDSTGPAVEVSSFTFREKDVCVLLDVISRATSDGSDERCLQVLQHVEEFVNSNLGNDKIRETPPVFRQTLDCQEVNDPPEDDVCSGPKSPASPAGVDATSCESDVKETRGTDCLVVCVISFDHIKAKHSRKFIVEHAASLGLTGVLRPGKPGLIVVEGPRSAVRVYEADIRQQLSTCTRTMGCWGPANHHFQSITVLSTILHPHPEIACFQRMSELETETIMHLGHIFIEAGLSSLFYECTGFNRAWTVPSEAGGPDPYLKQRGGTKMKKSNKRIH